MQHLLRFFDPQEVASQGQLFSNTQNNRGSSRAILLKLTVILCFSLGLKTAHRVLERLTTDWESIPKEVMAGMSVQHGRWSGTAMLEANDGPANGSATTVRNSITRSARRSASFMSW